eukprot:UN03539
MTRNFKEKPIIGLVTGVQVDEVFPQARQNGFSVFEQLNLSSLLSGLPPDQVVNV